MSDTVATGCLEDRLADLKRRIAGFESVLVALSGGIDSTVLLYVCRDVLGDRVLALTSTSVTTPEPDLSDARDAVADLGVRHELIETHELEVPEYAENSSNRCFHCKDELYRRAFEVAAREGIEIVVDGANADDVGDHRPGMRAGHELGVRSPLLEAGIGKQDIREIARRYGVPIWRKPSSACLSSRFPYGTRIERADVERVAAAEACLRELGFAGIRVRHHGTIARIEAPPQRIAELAAEAVRVAIVARFKTIGYHYVALDLEGYRSGSLNEVLDSDGAFEA